MEPPVGVFASADGSIESHRARFKACGKFPTDDHDYSKPSTPLPGSTSAVAKDLVATYVIVAFTQVCDFRLDTNIRGCPCHL